MMMMMMAAMNITIGGIQLLHTVPHVDDDGDIYYEDNHDDFDDHDDDKLHSGSTPPLYSPGKHHHSNVMMMVLISRMTRYMLNVKVILFQQRPWSAYGLLGGGEVVAIAS